MDTSASMAATDVAPNRLAAARTAAIEALGDLPTGGRVSVIAVDRSARIVVNDTSDISRVRQALDELEPAATRGDLGDALELASKLAARSGDAQILIATDAALATVPTTKVDAPIKVLPVGRDRKNQAIVALAVRTSPSSVTRSVFVSVANLDIESAQRRIEVWGDDRLLEARDVDLDAQARSDVVIDDVPADVAVVEVRLVGRDATSAAAPDQLAIDDRAWAVLPAAQTRLVLLVGEGDPYLETALSYLPNVELYGVEPADYGPASAANGRTPLGPDHLRVDPADDPAVDTDPGHRATEDERTRRGERDTQGSGHRLAQPGRAGPALRRPLDDPHLAVAAPHDAGLGAHDHPGTEGRSPALHRRAGRPADRRPRVRTAALRPAAAGGLPDPAVQSHRRTAGWIGGPDRGGVTRHARQSHDPVRRDRRDRHGPRRHDDGSRRERHRRILRLLCRDRPPGHLHGRADPADRCIAGSVVERGAERRRDTTHERATVRCGLAGRIGRAGRPERAGPLRRGPVRRRRVDDRPRVRDGDRRAGQRPGSVGGAGQRRPRPTDRRPATSCGSRSCSSSSSGCASSGASITATRSYGCVARWRRGSADSRTGPPRWASRSKRRWRCCS